MEKLGTLGFVRDCELSMILSFTNRFSTLHSSERQRTYYKTMMPCGLPADDAIPLAQYGRSNLGRAKTIYRNGLTYRSGAHRIGTRILLKPVGEQELLRAISKALTSR